MPECRHEIQKFLLIILIINTARYGAKTLPLIFYFYKRESYNNLCISKYQCSLAYTANHITHRLKETQNSKMAYKKGACIQVQLEFRMQALLSSPFI